MQTQDSTVVTFTKTITVTVPRTITEATPREVVEDACHAYWQAAGGEEARASFGLLALVAFADAMVEGSAITTLYTDDEGQQTARTLFPTAITLTKDRNICIRAWCSLRRQVKSFRLDRCVDAHALTMPGEVTA